MKAGLLTLATILLIGFNPTSNMAHAYCADSGIGLYTDEFAVICHAPAVVGSPVEVPLIAMFGAGAYLTTEIAITLANLPEDSELGHVVSTWQIPPSSGDLTTELVWIFDPPVPVWELGPLLHLGTIQFTPLDSSWIESDHIVELVDGRVVDTYQQNHWGGNQDFTFNCTTGSCYCYGFHGGHCITALDFQPEPDAIIQGEFMLEFRVESWDTGEYSGWSNYTGQITVNDSLVSTIDNVHIVSVPLSTGDLESGDEMRVEIDLENAGDTTHAELVYLVDTVTGIGTQSPNGSWSLIKSLY
jgi:hypothetical protein